MNEYDSQKVLKILEPDFIPVQTPGEADLVLVNTCSIRDKAEHKLYSYLGRLRDADGGEKLMIGVGGCVAQQEGEKILERGAAVDFVYGTHNLSVVPSLIRGRELGLPPQAAVDYRDGWEELPLGLEGGSKVSALISISRGCNKSCTYCIVPTTRGKEVSRPVEEILREIRIQAHRGAREVVLLGQTVNSYGLDLKPRGRFTDLLERVAAIEEIERIRFTSPHPQEIRNDFIDLVSSCTKICRHVHMPLQAGSNRILRAMNRNYKRERYIEIIESIRARVPDMAVTTDIIVGFPGESRTDFEETLDIIGRLRFDASYSYLFSPRPGTVAENLEDPVSESEKKEWLWELQKLQGRLTEESLARWVGKEVEVLVERASSHDSDILCGRTSQNIVLNLEAGSGKFLEPGDMVDVHVTGKGRFTLNGQTLLKKPRDRREQKRFYSEGSLTVE